MQQLQRAPRRVTARYACTSVHIPEVRHLCQVSNDLLVSILHELAYSVDDEGSFSASIVIRPTNVRLRSFWTGRVLAQFAF